MQYELEVVKDTIRAGLDDIETICGLADRTLDDNAVENAVHGKILHQSGRLAVLASSLDNDELEQLFTAIESGESHTIPIPARELRSPLELVSNPHRTYLRWNKAIGNCVNKTVGIAGCFSCFIWL